MPLQKKLISSMSPAIAKELKYIVKPIIKSKYLTANMVQVTPLI